MLNIKIISSGIFTSIQDAGRMGNNYYGIPRSGFMDVASAQLANLIAGNDIAAPLIEMTYKAASIKFDKDAVIALSGADMDWKLDGKNINRLERIFVKKNQFLSGTYSAKGLRAYLAVQGDIQNLQKDYGSSSTYNYASLGGLNGKALSKGDCLNVFQERPSVSSLKINIRSTKLDSKSIDLEAGPDMNLLDPKSEKTLYTANFKILPASNRMGARLESDKLIKADTDYKAGSKPLLPGTIQLLPSGQLIVILQDGQTTGGYPRIGFIPHGALDAFNQIRPGLSFKFKKN